MRIVIDMQGAQGTHRKRGVARYTLSLAQAIVRQRGKHEVFLSCNESSVDEIREAFKGLLPEENIRVWYAPPGMQQVAELIREAHLASLRPDIVLMSHVFEPVTSMRGRTAAILYDLIPYEYRDLYLKDEPEMEAWYLDKVDLLKRADLLLCISEYTGRQAERLLNFPRAKICNIAAGVDEGFREVAITPEKEQEIRQRYGLTKPFVMYTGGYDQRKFAKGLIRAFGKLPKDLRSSHQLAIVCSLEPVAREILKSAAKNVELVLTGYVPEEDLVALYNLCTVSVFPSWAEGFGLPILEAMSCGKGVLAANASSCPEILGYEEALFESKNEGAITEKLEQVLRDDAFRLKLEAHARKQCHQFSWDKSARRAIEAMEMHAGNRSDKEEDLKTWVQRIVNVGPSEAQAYLPVAEALAKSILNQR